ncbi:hypothetical protein CPC08DRAFT_728170 [Agrocybe pediades]|nr:hypothetical protein CPC08DRAFT_728170 [Agrocybe pediades]
MDPDKQALRVLRKSYRHSSVSAYAVTNATFEMADAGYSFLDEEASRFGFRTARLLLGMLKKTSALISGSLALAVILPGSFYPRDIDFYVLEDRHYLLISFIFLSGYHEIPTAEPSYMPSGPTVIKSVSTFIRPGHGEEPYTTVNVITVHADCHILDSITSFHSTLVMNAISWNGFICFYPEWTLFKQGLIIIHTPRTRRCFTKYWRRGFTFLQAARRFFHRLPARNIHGHEVRFFPFVNSDLSRICSLTVCPFTWKLSEYCSYDYVVYDED